MVKKESTKKKKPGRQSKHLVKVPVETSVVSDFSKWQALLRQLLSELLRDIVILGFDEECTTLFVAKYILEFLTIMRPCAICYFSILFLPNLCETVDD
jgi:hypothetical protein